MESSISFERLMVKLDFLHQLTTQGCSHCHQIVFQIGIEHETARAGYQNLMLQPIAGTIAVQRMLNDSGILPLISKIEKLVGLCRSLEDKTVAGTRRLTGFTRSVGHIICPPFENIFLYANRVSIIIIIYFYDKVNIKH